MPDSGLAHAIGIFATLIVLGGLLLGVLLSQIFARRLGWSGAKLFFATMALGAIGLGGGVLIVVANYREDIWAPSPEVTLNVPAGFTQDWVILLEDRSSSVQLVWQGVDIPFFGKRTLIDVPSSGIVRLRDLRGLRGPRGTRVLWSDGSYHGGYASGPAPKSTGATSNYSAFHRGEPDAEREPPFNDDAALGAYIAARERGTL
jgi:hypothetical protein